MAMQFTALSEKLNTKAFFLVKEGSNDEEVCVQSFKGTEIVGECGTYFTKEDLNAFFKKHILPRSYLSISRSGEKRFTCNSCNESFSKYADLKGHIKCNEKCKICLKVFSKRSELKLHMKIHSHKPHTCQECGAIFKYKYQLCRHSHNHDSPNCKEETESKEKLSTEFYTKKDLLSLLEAGPYICQECGKEFKQSFQLQKHHKVHIEEETFGCGMREKRFNCNSGLSSHLVIHKKRKCHICEMCNKSFRSPSHLKAHYRTHTKEKPFECELCGKCFSIIHKLHAHYRIHTEERPFYCCKCDKSYRHRHSLTIHERKHHKVTLEENVGNA